MKLEDDLYYYPWTSMVENNCNSYYLGGKIPTLIDTGHKHRVSNLSSLMESDGIDPKGIKLVISTHAHPDHFEGNQIFANNGAMMAIHKEEDRFLREVGGRFYRMFGMEMPDFKADFYLKEGNLVLGKNELQIYHTPGHSPGSISVYWPEKKALITGDVVFNQGVGRTDFPGCDGRLLKESIEKLSRLDVEYLLPGHGDIIVGRNEVIQNFDFIKKAIFAYL
ncbi:MAG: MBL fold metallo-hydrolase [Deltaproteobacteria bacterium]|jgi:glyoxylase-like metal-dependent hydrolase (beta-lactamase superfamily II)|nr:MAG: MBL fold metallo-hydrolase [Deltaproteobacteria bacterium]